MKPRPAGSHIPWGEINFSSLELNNPASRLPQGVSPGPRRLSSPRLSLCEFSYTRLSAPRTACCIIQTHTLGRHAHTLTRQHVRFPGVPLLVPLTRQPLHLTPSLLPSFGCQLDDAGKRQSWQVHTGDTTTSLRNTTGLLSRQNPSHTLIETHTGTRRIGTKTQNRNTQQHDKALAAVPESKCASIHIMCIYTIHMHIIQG